MTHKKKSVSSALLRSAALVITPVIAAWVLPALHSRSVKADAEPVSFSQAEYNVSDSGIKSVLNEGLILSEGYGVTPETADDKTDTGLISPLDMTAENAGEKPYPTEWGGGGSIIRTTYGIYSGNTYFDLEKCGQVNNKTDIPNDTLLNESRCLPNFTIKDTDEPQVLIYHTHTTESFEPFVRDEYDAGFNYRTTDPTKNVVMVGDAIQAELESRGIGVIHVRTIHDYPSYNGSYARSRETIVPILEQYPDIKVALDIHRDAVAGDGVSYQPYIEADGREAAQVMIISGCDDGTLGMPEYMKNFHFACSLQQKMESAHPGLTRPILFDYRHYNQNLTTGSLLIEVGSHCNTLDQVQYAGQLVGRSLAELLLSIKE
ncbi:MAG TPA: stage II sporulation protein P, partial [Ruminococcus flavefaciens]|nr:stage II sporulation protein P [Ruminococcus flavefaciens]